MCKYSAEGHLGPFTLLQGEHFYQSNTDLRLVVDFTDNDNNHVNYTPFELAKNDCFIRIFYHAVNVLLEYLNLFNTIRIEFTSLCRAQYKKCLQYIVIHSITHHI